MRDFFNMVETLVTHLEGRCVGEVDNAPIYWLPTAEKCDFVVAQINSDPWRQAPVHAPWAAIVAGSKGREFSVAILPRRDREEKQ